MLGPILRRIGIQKSKSRVVIKVQSTTTLPITQNLNLNAGFSILNSPSLSLHFDSPFHQNYLIKIHHQFRYFFPQNNVEKSTYDYRKKIKLGENLPILLFLGQDSLLK